MRLANQLVFVQWLLALSVCLCNGQDAGSNSSTGAVKRDPERGVIFSVTAVHASHVHLIHVPVMPYYEPVKRPLSAPAYQFTNPAIDFLSVDVDFRDKSLFLYERDSRSIIVITDYKSPVTEGRFGPAYYLNIGVSNGAVQIAYDWLSKTLYLVDSALKWVLATTGDISYYLSPEFFNFNMVKIIIEGDLEHPEGLAVDPLNGLLFFCDNGRHPKIEKANLDGSGRTTLIRRGLGKPESLEVDIAEKRVYWVDQGKETVEYMNYDGTGRTRLRLFSGAVLGDIGIFRTVVIVTDVNPGRAHFLNKTSGEVLWPQLEFKDNYMYGVCVYNIETQPLKQISGKNCSELACEHLCISTSTSPKCECYHGFEWDAATKKCKESVPSVRKALVIALERYICLKDLRTLNSFSHYIRLTCSFWTLYPSETTTTPGTTSGTTSNTTSNMTTEAPYDPANDPANTIKLIDTDTRKRIVYFVAGDNSIYGRQIDAPINDTFRDFIASATGTINGLVYDWVNTNNLYWIESDTRTLQMVDLTTRSVSNPVGIAEGVPSNLVMLYRTSRLAWWSRNIAGVYALKTMFLGGTVMKTVVTRKTTVISTLVIDDEKELFYWIEGSAVYSMPYDASSDAEVVTNLDSSGYTQLLHYKNYLMWGGHSSTKSTQFQTYQIDTKTLGDEGSFASVSRTVGVKALDISLTPYDITTANPCAKQNGGCDHICINEFSGPSQVKTCHCSLGYTLKADKLTCKSDYVSKDFALVTDVTYGRIYQIDLAKDVTYALNYRETAIYNNVFYHKANQEVIWTERNSDNIFAGNIDSSNEHIIDNKATGSPGAMGLDETTGNLYFADNTYPYKGSVRVLTPQGYGFEFLKDIIEYQEFITAIDVHPQRGWLYVAVRSSYFASYVLRSNLDGSNVRQIVLDTHTAPSQFPLLEGLVIDHNTDQIYWSDYTQDAIYKCDLDLQSCDVFHSESLADIRELATDGEYLYYTSWNYHHLKRISLKDKTETELGRNIELGKLESVTVYRTAALNKQKVSQPCEERNGRGNCSTVCFPTQTGRRCACEGNIALLADNRTCSNVLQCGQTFTDGDQRQITMVPECLRYVGDDCKYVCPLYFAPIKRPVNDVTLRCNNDTNWDRRNEGLCVAVHCPHTITAGRIADDCSITQGGSCEFTCNQGTYKNPFVNSLTCRVDRTWESNGNQPCIDTQCPTTIMNGRVDDQCNRRVASKCSYTCDMKYRKTKLNIGSVVCKAQGAWNQTNNLCEEITCPASFSGVLIDGQCDRKIASTCTYSCSPLYTKNENVSRVVCKEQGAWNQSEGLCIPPVQTVAAESKQSNSKTVGIGVGTAAAVLIIIALILLLVLCRKRLGMCGGKKDELPPASFNNSPIDGIENPGYMNAAIQVTNDAYDQRSIAGSESAYTSISEAGSTKGLKKFFYGNKETLPDNREIETPQKREFETPTGDPSKMTASNWLKQRDSDSYKY